jgi:hypothetical protein
MKTMLRFLFAANRKRRRRTVRMIAPLLVLILVAECDEMNRLSDMLDSYDSLNHLSSCEYHDIEGKLINSECAFGFLKCAVDDFKFAY